MGTSGGVKDKLQEKLKLEVKFKDLPVVFFFCLARMEYKVGSWKASATGRLLKSAAQVLLSIQQLATIYLNVIYQLGD